MNRIPLNEELWWLFCASGAGALFLQRDHLADANIATIFLVIGTLLVAWRLTGRKAVPANGNVRHPVARVLGVIAGLFIAAVVVSRWPSFERDQTASTAVVETPPAPEVDEPVVSRAPTPLPDDPTPVAPVTLLQEFLTNSFLAGQKYRGHVVQITGVVTAIAPGGNEVAYLQLSVGSGRVETLQAMFPRDPSQILGLKPGDRVTLSGSPRYDADLESVALDDSTLVK